MKAERYGVGQHERGRRKCRSEWAEQTEAGCFCFLTKLRTQLVTAPKRKRLGFTRMPPHPTGSRLECLQTTMQDIYRSVHIPIQHKPTIRASVGTFPQGFLNQFAALRTHFRRIAGVYQNHSSASFFRFADCHTDELIPRYIHNALSHSTALAHFLRGKFFKHDDLIPVHQSTALLMGKISTAIRNPFVNSRQNAFLLRVLRPILRVLGSILFLLYPLHIGFITPM